MGEKGDIWNTIRKSLNNKEKKKITQLYEMGEKIQGEGSLLVSSIDFLGTFSVFRSLLFLHGK